MHILILLLMSYRIRFINFKYFIANYLLKCAKIMLEFLLMSLVKVLKIALVSIDWNEYDLK